MAQLSSSSIKDSHLLFLGAVAHQLSLTMMFPSFKMTGSVKGKNLKYMFLLLSDGKKDSYKLSNTRGGNDDDEN